MKSVAIEKKMREKKARSSCTIKPHDIFTFMQLFKQITLQVMNPTYIVNFSAIWCEANELYNLLVGSSFYMTTAIVTQTVAQSSPAHFPVHTVAIRRCHCDGMRPPTGMSDESRSSKFNFRQILARACSSCQLLQQLQLRQAPVTQ